MPTDHELVRQALSGRIDAAQALLLRHAPALRRDAGAGVWQSFDGDADDVMQDFYFKVCRNGFRALAQWRGLTEPGQQSIEPYFKAILRNVLMDFARQRRDARQRDGEDALDDIPDPADTAENEVANEQLRAAMQLCIDRALNDDQRNIVRLFLEGHGHAEIARRLGIDEGTSRVRLHRAVKALRRCIESTAGNELHAGGVLE